MATKIILQSNDRGFLCGEFVDEYGFKCSIQESSLASKPAIWLGLNGGEYNQVSGDCPARMHLTQDHAAELIPLLIRFVECGELD